MRIQKMDLIAAVFTVTLWALALWGYCANIYKLVGGLSDDMEFTTMFFVRCVGAIAFPLGMILGWV